MISNDKRLQDKRTYLVNEWRINDGLHEDGEKNVLYSLNRAIGLEECEANESFRSLDKL